MQDYNITTAAGRQRLAKGRREPYWRRLEGTGYLGYRKFKSERWVARWRDGRGQTFTKPLGPVTRTNDYKGASRAAREWFQQCEQGVIRSITVDQAFKDYLANMEKMKPQAVSYSWCIYSLAIKNNDIGKLHLDELLPADVRKWRDSLVTDKRSKVTVNRLLAALKAVLNFAYRNGTVASDRAWKTVEKFPDQPKARKNFLSKEQVKAMLDAAPPDLRALLKGFLFTGCRPGELVQARRSALDLGAGTLTLVTSKGRGGEQRRREVPLAGAAYTHFAAQAKDKLPEAFLMTRNNGDGWYKMGWSRGIIKIREEIDILPNDLCAYDLRHTTISNWLANGVNIETVAKVTGTSIGMIDKHYHKFVPTDVADQLSAIAIV